MMFPGIIAHNDIKTAAIPSAFMAPRVPGGSGAQVLVLDLDETLVHTFDKHEAAALEKLPLISDSKLFDLRTRTYFIDIDITDSQGIKTGHIMKLNGVTRPHLYEFLDYAFRRFSAVVIWSAGSASYVQNVVPEITSHLQSPHDILTANDCIKTRDGPTKPLKELIKLCPQLTKHVVADLSNVFLVDDNPLVSVTNPGNEILIPAYDPDSTIHDMRKDDTSLKELMKWFESPSVVGCTDVRKLNKTQIFMKK
jgi:hypothetical protein